jgi:hypothetical protein
MTHQLHFFRAVVMISFPSSNRYQRMGSSIWVAPTSYVFSYQTSLIRSTLTPAHPLNHLFL